MNVYLNCIKLFAMLAYAHRIDVGERRRPMEAAIETKNFKIDTFNSFGGILSSV